MIRSKKIIRINVSDNVAVALDEIKPGEVISLGNETIVAKENIDAGHKIALENINPGENVIKYGYPIGHATKDIAAGEHIHSHNIKTNLNGILEYTYNPKSSPNNYGNLDPDNNKFKNNNSSSTSSQEFFMGYPRKNGSVGIRNEIWIVNTVGCVNKTAEILANASNNLYAGKTDGIFSFSHPFGCSQLGDDHLNTQKVLAALVNHPNAAGVLVIGLGCENNNITEFKKVLGEYDENRVKFLVTQEVEDELDTGIKIIGELVEYASSFTKEPCPLSKLVVGLKCGGSDGFSGITANPLVGVYSDMLISKGGTTILTEVPEMTS